MTKLLYVLPLLTLGLSPLLADDTSSKSGAAAQASGAESASPEFVRVLKEGDAKQKPVSLQTAVVTYRDGKEYPDLEIALIGAVHIAEKSYYEQLNKVFKKYDALLYEMVTDPNRGVPAEGERGSSPVSTVQVGMKDMLKLSFQLDEVDYHAANFVHADMSPEEFFDSMKKRKEGVLQMIIRSVGYGLAMQGAGKANDIDMLSAMFSENRARDMRRAFADQFEMMEGQMAALQGDDGRSTLITERNAKAFAVLKEQIAAGKKKLAIFYGAGHLKDMDQRLRKEYHMHPVETQWLDAWDLR